MRPEAGVQVRPAQPPDASAIRDLVRAAYAVWVPVIGREPLPMKVDYAEALLAHEIDLLLANDVLVGLIETMRQPDHLWIENIAVRPDSQGRGWGRRLLAHAEEKANAAGLRQIRLLTNEAFAANVDLYTRFGYGIDRREAFMNGVTVYMSKPLGAAPRIGA